VLVIVGGIIDLMTPLVECSVRLDQTFAQRLVIVQWFG
jgi:hypothetical protein